MLRINLLPWRQQLIEQHKKQFWHKVLITFLLFISIFYMVRLLLINDLNMQQTGNQQLTQKIHQQNISLASLRKKANEIASMQEKLNYINQLISMRNNTVQLFDILPQLIPKQVELQNMAVKQLYITIEGQGENSSNLAQMLFLLEQHKEIKNVKMHTMVNLDGNKGSQFKATFELDKENNG